MTNVGFDLLTDQVREYSLISNNHTDQIVIDQLIQKFLHKKIPKFKILGKLANVNSYSFS
jgi:hypothetical protein